MFNGRLAIFTICSNNYVPMARILLDSAVRYHPAADLFLVIADEKFDDDAFYPADAQIVTARELNVPRFDAFSFRYDIMEFNTAVKPFMFLRLLEMGYDKVLYFDPDIEVFRRLDTVLDPLEGGASFVFTPHICRPAEGDAYPGDIGVMQAGTYNLGFLGVGAGRDTDEILRWWARRLEYQCVNDQERGIFVDQKFMDLVPGFTDHAHVARDTTLNVAYWNLHQRRLTATESGWTVDGRPLGFFHFSGFDPRDLTRLSKHTAAFRGEAIDAGLLSLMRRYGDRIVASGHGTVPGGLYAYGRFRSGTPIPEFVRRVFREDHVYWADDPFESFETFLNAPSARRWAGPHGGLVTNLMASLRDRLPALQEIIDPERPEDATTFVRWWLDHALPYVGDERLVEPVAQRLGDGWKPPRRAPAKRAPGEPDIDVVGYLGLALGVGEAGRLTLQSLRAAGLDAGGVAVALNTPAPAVPFATDALLVPKAEAPVQLFNVNADQIGPVIDAMGARLRPDAYRIMAPFWELPILPEAWHRAFDRVDEVWAPTRFIQTLVLRSIPHKPVVRMPLTLDFAPPPPIRRGAFGLPAHKFLFFFSFDYLSYLDRKNPAAILAAFRRAFRGRRGDPPVALVLKTLNADRVPEKARALRDLLIDDPDVIVIDRTLSRDEAVGLMAACDAVVSLHRSEGLGLLVAEAMVMGRPVIATDFSATTELVMPDTGYPVDFRLIPVEEGQYPFHAGQHWADADVDHAAWLMRRVVEGGSEVSRRTEAASRHIRENYGQAAVGRLQRRRLRMIEDLR